jgi:hypothetical protein
MARPREYDREEVGKRLVEWARKDDSINLNKFCALNDFAPATFFRWRDEDPGFRESYDKAKTFLAFRREELLNKGKLHVKAYDMNATAYDAFCREERRSELQYESSLRKEDESTKNMTINIVDYSAKKCKKPKA